MKKFQFSLKALLSYREHLEQIAQQELAKVQAEINAITALIEEFELSRDNTREELDARSEAGITALDMGRYMDYLAGLEQNLNEARAYRSQLLRLAEKKRGVLTVKSVERKIITNLKERRKADYVDEAGKAFQKQADEMVLVSRLFGANNDGTDSADKG
jgi:flagellar export protein FliJ